jgi:hypothetical protein
MAGTAIWRVTEPDLTKFSIFFLVPPKRPLILNEKGHKVESMVGPFNEGASLRITCISDKEGKLSFLASGAATLAVTTLRITTLSIMAYL